MDHDDAGRDEQDSSSWESLLRFGGLVVVILAMVWLAFNVRIPELPVLRDQIEGFGWLSWLVFIAAYAVVGLTPIPISLMALTGGVLFGPVAGTLLSVAGSMLGNTGAYGIARGLGKETVLRLLGSHRRTVEKRLASAGFETLFALRVMPGLPYWPVNYGAGALGVRFSPFVTSSLIASIPGQASLVSVGAFAAEPSVVMGIVVLVSWAVVVALTVWAWRAAKGSSSRPLPGAGLER